MPGDTRSEPLWRLIDIDADADRLAKMWNDSDDQWPGTWTGGVPMTAQSVRRRFESERPIEILVCDAGDEIAGYCSVWKDPEESDVAWIALLNVAPAYQKLSLARKVLVHWVARAAELGFARLDLGTWGGNTKSVPLYKKTGFFWRPGPWPHLLNFMPAILQAPLARPFFDRHDWYSSFVRELGQFADDERWEGMKTFTYRFEAGGESLSVVVDREARAITAVDTPDLLVATIVDDLEPGRGLRAPIRWRVENRSTRAREVSLVAFGSEHLGLQHRETITVEPGAQAERDAMIDVAARIPDSAVREWEKAPAVRSIVVVDGEAIELSTGMRPRRPVEVDTHPRLLTITPGVPTTVHLQLRNRLKHDIDATLTLAPPEGLDATWSERTLTIPAESFGGIEVELTGTRGVHELPVAIAFEHDGERIETPAEPEWIFARAPGDLLAARLRDSVRAENDEVTLIVASVGAGVTFHAGPDRTFTGRESGYPSPPAKANEFESAEYNLGIEREDGRVVVTAWRESKEHPGLVVHKRVELGAGPVTTIGYRFENQSSVDRRFRLTEYVLGRGSSGEETLPLRDGVTAGPMNEFPGSPDDTSRRVDFYVEDWWARTTERATIGAVWAREDADELIPAWNFSRISTYYDIPARGRAMPTPMHVYASDGGWRAVRALWRRLHGVHPDRSLRDPDPTPFLTARLERPVVSTNGEAEAAVVIEHRSTRALAGEVTLELPDGWEADRTTLDLTGLTWREPVREVIGFKTTAAPGAYAGRVQVRSPDQDATFAIPLIRLGDGRAVSVTEDAREGQRVLTIENGRLAIVVMPEFGMTVGSIREGDVEHLLCGFPTRGTFAYSNEWHGGLTSAMWLEEEQKIWREEATAEAITVDASGVRWSGVRQRCALTDDPNARGLHLEIDVLTTGGSPVVRVVQRLINATSAVREASLGLYAYVQPDGARAGTLVGPNQRLKQTERVRVARAGHWAAAVNPDTGRALGLVTDTPETWLVHYGPEGGHLQTTPAAIAQPDAAVERTTYVVIADDAAVVERYAALKDL